MDIGDMLAPSLRPGRRASALEIQKVREITVGDLPKLKTARHISNPIKKLNPRHHQLARLLASGYSVKEAAVLTGFTPSSVSTLKSTDLFSSLLTLYEKEVQAEYLDVHTKLKTVSAMALDVIADRIEDEPEEISTATLLEVVKMGADRTGNGPATSSANLTVNMRFGDAMRASNERARERFLPGEKDRPAVIDITPTASDEGVPVPAEKAPK